MKINIDFEIEKQEALTRIKNLIPQLKEDFKTQISEVHEEWDNDKAIFGFKIMGFAIKGKFVVTENQAIIDASLPFAALMFRGMIETKIKEEATKLLKK